MVWENENTINGEGEHQSDRRHDRCPVCEDLLRGPLCKTHRQELAKTIHGLGLGLVELKAVERREVKFTGRGGEEPGPRSRPYHWISVLLTCMTTRRM